MTQTDPVQRLPSQLNSLGPFFAIAEYPAAAASGWRPLAELVTDPAALSARIETVRARLTASGGRRESAVERRAAASAVLLGLAARLLSPALAAAVLEGILLDLDLTRLRWQPSPDSGFPLAVPAQALRPGPAGIGPMAAGLTGLLAGPIGQLVASLQAVCPLSPLVAWGNVGSALNGAAIVLGQQRPELASETYRLTSAVLARPPLDMLDPVAGPAFRRNSCCLLYRIVPAGRDALCGDCVLIRQ